MFELTNLKLQENNPRFIKDERFAKLKQSIEQFPKMMALRPIVTDTNGVVLGGNMRLRALLDLGFKSVPESWVKKADELTEEEKRRFIIADNTGFGQWDYEILSNEWEAVELEEWGFEAPDEWRAGDTDLSGFFDVPDEDESSIEKTNKIILEYTEEEAVLVRDALAKVANTPEQAVWKILIDNEIFNYESSSNY